VHGEPGAVSDPDAQGWLVNLDRAEPAVLFDINDDGSFSAGVEASAGEELRLQLRRGDVRSAPLDFVLVSDSATTIVPSTRALGSCLIVEPATQLGLRAPGPTTRSLLVSNDCAEPVQLAPIALRLPDAPYTVLSVDGVLLEPGGQHAVEVELPGEASPDEILFVEADSPARDRRPITLFSIHGP